MKKALGMMFIIASIIGSSSVHAQDLLEWKLSDDTVMHSMIYMNNTEITAILGQGENNYLQKLRNDGSVLKTIPLNASINNSIIGYLMRDSEKNRFFYWGHSGDTTCFFEVMVDEDLNLS